MFATIIDDSSGLVSSDDSTWDITYPDGVQTDDLLFLLLGVDGNTDISGHDGGWAQGRSVNGTAVSLICAKKKASAAHSGSFTLTLNAAEQGCWRMLLLRPWGGTLGSNFTNSDPNGGDVPGSGSDTGNGGSAPVNFLNVSLSPFGWDASAEDTTWISAIAADHGDTTISGGPSGFTALGAQESGGAGGAALQVWHREVRHSEPYDMFAPGDVTLDAAEEHVMLSFAVRGGAEPSYTIVNGSDETLTNVNAAGDDIAPGTYRDGVALTETELAAIFTLAQKDVAVFPDLTGDAQARQRKKATLTIPHAESA